MPEREADPRYIGDYGIGTGLRRLSAWGLDQLTFGAVDALTEEIDKYGNRVLKVPAVKDYVNVGIKALPALTTTTTIEKLDTTKPQNYNDIINEVYLPGNSLTKRNLPSPIQTAQRRMGMKFGEQGVLGKDLQGHYTPPPAWTRGLTESQMKEMKRLYLDQFAEASLLPDGTLDTTNPLVYKPEVKVSPRGVPISKRREAAYKFQGELAAEWNKWSDDTQFIDELSDYPKTAFVEHLVGKGDRLNWFWNLPDHVRFMKGSRHGPSNTRIFYSDRQKRLKDATENILYNMQKNVPEMDRLIVVYDVPEMEGKSITVRQPSGDVLLKTVDGTIVGRIGDFFDVLYAPTEDLIKGLTTNINPRTGNFYIDPNTGNMKKAIRHWREEIIKNKLNKIIDEAPDIKDKPASVVYQEQVGEIIDEEMAAFRKEYDFIPKPRGSTLDAEMAATSFEEPPPDLPLLNDLLSMKPKPEVKEFLTKNPEGLNMLIDSLNGMDWRQLRSNYKHRYKRGKLEKVKSQLTSAQVQRIKQEYKQGGKAGYLSDLNRREFKPPFKDYHKTLEQKTTRYKGTGRVDYEDIVDEAWED